MCGGSSIYAFPKPKAVWWLMTMWPWLAGVLSSAYAWLQPAESGRKLYCVLERVRYHLHHFLLPPPLQPAPKKPKPSSSSQKSPKGAGTISWRQEQEEELPWFTTHDFSPSPASPAAGHPRSRCARYTASAFHFFFFAYPYVLIDPGAEPEEKLTRCTNRLRVCLLC